MRLGCIGVCALLLGSAACAATPDDGGSANTEVSGDSSAAGGDSGATFGDPANTSITDNVPDEDLHGDSDQDAEADPCAGGPSGFASDSSSADAALSGYGSIEIDGPVANTVTFVKTTLVVPPHPSRTGTVFLWPGLQPLPGGANFDPIDNGVLQPVLTWGPTCAPNAPQATPYASWWVSAQYVNTDGSDPGFTGCLGGDGMNVQPGELLTITMTLNGTVWTQTIVDDETQQSVSYAIDLQGQAQARVLFVVEDYDGGAPSDDVIFLDSQIGFDASVPDSCQPIRRGANDYFSAPRASVDGTHCCISWIVLRAETKTPTTP